MPLTVEIIRHVPVLLTNHVKVTLNGDHLRTRFAKRSSLAHNNIPRVVLPNFKVMFPRKLNDVGLYLPSFFEGSGISEIRAK